MQPAYNTPDYWAAVREGRISWEAAGRAHARYEERRRRARDSRGTSAAIPARHLRPAPRESRQWCRPMATTAARDDRLTPQAKALLQVLTARCGRHGWTETTKGTLGDVMSRHPRSIQRYVRELIRFGYIRARAVRSAVSGLYTGMRLWVTAHVLPYFSKRMTADLRALAGAAAGSRGNPGETVLSPVKSPVKKKRAGGGDDPPPEP